MKRIFLFCLLALVAAVPWSMQTTKQVTLQWDAMPVGELWQQVRIYDISQPTEALLATVNCLPGPPVTCANTATFTVQKRAYSFVARSYDGFWESDNSNTAILPGPPKPPTGVKK